MRKPAVLVVVPAAPFPARRNGIAVRYAPVLNSLAQSCDLDVVQVVSPWAKAMQAGADNGVLRSFDTLSRPRAAPSLMKRGIARLRTAIYPAPPHAAYSFHARTFRNDLARILHGRYYDSALWISGRFAGEALPVLRAHAARVVLDAVDSMYSHARKISRRNPLSRWDLHWLRRWELRLAERFDETAYISQREIELLKAANAEAAPRLMHIPNGVLPDGFSEDRAHVPEFNEEDFVVAFLGHMAYPPNVRAALRLKRILDGLQPGLRKVKMLIIGRSPARVVQEMGEASDVVVTGAVDNIWPYVNRASIFLFPMEAGAGQQNKVLEAMYASKPVISTQIANDGIGARDGNEILLARTDQEFRDRIRSVCDSPALIRRIGQAGRDFVVREYSWDAILPKFHALVFSAPRSDS